MAATDAVAFPVAAHGEAGSPRRIVRVAVTCALTAMVGSGRRPGTGGLLRGAGRDPVAVWRGCPDWAGAVKHRLSCLTLPLPVRACPAPCSLGCEGSWVGPDGLPRASPELPAWPGGSGSLGGGVSCGQPLVPTGLYDPFESFRIRSWGERQ